MSAQSQRPSAQSVRTCEAVKTLSSERDELSARDEVLARIDADKAKALTSLRIFEKAHRDATRKGDPCAVLAAVNVGLEAVRAHLSDLSRQRKQWVA